MEAHLEHHQPVAVTHHAEGLHQSVEGAVTKLSRLLDSTIDRRRDEKIQNESFIAQEPPLSEV